MYGDLLDNAFDFGVHVGVMPGQDIEFARDLEFHPAAEQQRGHKDGNNELYLWPQAAQVCRCGSQSAAKGILEPRRQQACKQENAEALILADQVLTESQGDPAEKPIRVDDGQHAV